MKRAAVCIGVNRAGTMRALKGAAADAMRFEQWARAQGCDTKLLTDDAGGRVLLADVFQAVSDFASRGIYDALIIYFSGHGILTAPSTEFWLLSQAPQNPSEAVNLRRSIDDGQWCGVPHVIFVSDACRSFVSGPPLYGVTGGSVFPGGGQASQPGEVDTYYATRPGDPALEVPEATAVAGHNGIFTRCLLEAMNAPDPSLVDQVQDGIGQLHVVASRKLKTYLEPLVPLEAFKADASKRQVPLLDVRTVLPKFFGTVSVLPPAAPAPDMAPPSLPQGSFLPGLPGTDEPLWGSAPAGAPPRSLPDGAALIAAHQDKMSREADELITMRGRTHFETETGLSVFGAGPVRAWANHWDASEAFREGPDPDVWHVRLTPPNQTPSGNPHSSVVLAFEQGCGACLPIIRGMIGTVIVRENRIISVSYVPSDRNWRFQDYLRQEQKLDRLKALAAVQARDGQFAVPDDKASQLADRIRMGKGLEPMLGLFAAYAYAQAGRYDQVLDVWGYMRDDSHEVPVPFDVAMLASRWRNNQGQVERTWYAPPMPMLSQGWALLAAGDPMHRPAHEQLRPHLIPALWTTFNSEGVKQAIKLIERGELV